MYINPSSVLITGKVFFIEKGSFFIFFIYTIKFSKRFVFQLLSETVTEILFFFDKLVIKNFLSQISFLP